MVGSNAFAKTICSICYEDLKPIVEDLQSISICGHVFHELCLQQWFEYCTDSKKQTCPVCKQGCTKKNVGRLYFQSVGDSAATQCQSQNPRNNGVDDEECPEILRFEVKKLEAKVSALNTAVDLHQKDVKELTDELHVCKEQLSKEVILKNEALRQKESIQALLQMKTNDLVKSKVECAKLQEKNLALVKEFAALKLVSDCNLEEEEIGKLASVGHEGNSQVAVDVLKRSLVIRNKKYLELMTQCNSLGRGEARSTRKLEKAKEKIVKLKARVQELESAIEVKDNEFLKTLQASKKESCNNVSLPSGGRSTKSSVFKHSAPVQKSETPLSVINLDEDGDNSPSKYKETEKNDEVVNRVESEDRSNQLKERTHIDCLSDDEHELQKQCAADTYAKAHNSKDDFLVKCGSSSPADSKENNINQPHHHSGLSGLAGRRHDVIIDSSSSKDSAGLLLQNIRQIQPSGHTSSVATSPIPLADSGDQCFAGGLLGPDGANRYLGKWCKRVKNNASKDPMYESNSCADSLIGVGADGRGGRVKVLRTLNQMTMDTKESIISAKKLKTGSKSSSLQTQGCLQIEHFFQKARS